MTCESRGPWPMASHCHQAAVVSDLSSLNEKLTSANKDLEAASFEGWVWYNFKRALQE